MAPFHFPIVCIAFLVALLTKTSVQQHESFYRGSDNRHANFLENPFLILDVPPVAVVKVLDALFCALECLRNTLCHSFNVALVPNADFNCQLLATDKYNSSDKLKYSEDFHHHSLLTPCEVSPCQNKGNCRPVYETHQYKCECQFGFGGINCEHKLVGARVFARWTNGLYYRGMIAWESADTFHVKFDDGDEISLFRNESKAIVLDVNPPKSAVTIRTEVIAWWPSRTRFYPGYVDKIDDGRYKINYDDGDQGWARLDQIRLYNFFFT